MSQLVYDLENLHKQPNMTAAKFKRMEKQIRESIAKLKIEEQNNSESNKTGTFKIILLHLLSYRIC